MTALPDTSSRRPLALSDIRNTVARLLDDAQQYVESELSGERIKATQYYQGEKFGNEEEGRSQFVSTDLRDTVRSILPSLLRVFFGAEKAVEYEPRTAQDVATAAQATDYVNTVILQTDNPGFLIFLAWFKDALIRRLGVVKWGWLDQTSIASYAMQVDTEQLLLLASDDAVDLDRVEAIGPDQHAAEFHVKRPGGKAWLACVPPDEFWYTRGARSLDHADIVAHVTEQTTSDLLSLGIPEAVIREHGGLATSRDTTEEQARQGSSTAINHDSPQWATEKHTYIEAFAKVDIQGTGEAELRKFCCLGPERWVVNGNGKGEPCGRKPFAMLIPDPEPHTLKGQGVSDWTMDIQKMNSSVIRAIADSLADSIFPRTAYVEGAVDVGDVMSTKIGQPIRILENRPPDSVLKEFTHEFGGAKALPFLELMNEVKRQRTGMVDATALDPDALQSSTKTGVAAVVTKAQEQIELIARVFAETGVKDLFRGLLELICEHQVQPRVSRLKGQWVTMDPRSWDATMDVRINVALGSGLEEEKIAVLQTVAEDQTNILSQMGLANPFVTPGQFLNTRKRVLQLKGFKDTTEFYQDLPVDWVPPPAPEQPDPNMLIAQAEMAKAQAEVQKKQADIAKQEVELLQRRVELETEFARKNEELHLKREQIVRQDDLERDKLDTEERLKAREIEVQRQTEMEKAQLQASVDLEKAKIDADAKKAVAKEGKKVTIGREKGE